MVFAVFDVGTGLGAAIGVFFVSVLKHVCVGPVPDTLGAFVDVEINELFPSFQKPLKMLDLELFIVGLQVSPLAFRFRGLGVPALVCFQLGKRCSSLDVAWFTVEFFFWSVFHFEFRRKKFKSN